MLDAAEFVRNAESLCRAVAPRDLGDVPLYVVPESALGEFGSGSTNCYGYTTSSLDLYLRPLLGKRWQGRGPAMVINDALIAGDASDQQDLEIVLRSVVLHELAHVLDRGELYRDRPDLDADVDKLTWEFAVVVNAVYEPSVTSTPTRVPYLGHELGFIRMALHLGWRAEELGFEVSGYLVHGTAQYGLSHHCRYEIALGDEPERLRDLPLREIARRPAPKRLYEVWMGDVSYFMKEIA